MAIIYTYPTVTPTLADKVLVSVDGTNATANATISSIVETMDVVDTFSNSFGTFISGLANSNATGDVRIGTIDLSATGTPSSTNFLKGNNTWSSVDLTADVTGILPIANGGTNASTANNALNNLLPSQTGNSDRILATDGADTRWIDAVDAGGTDTQMQYNNSGAFGGTTGLTWDDSTNILSIATRYEGDIDGALLQQVLVKEPGGVNKGDVVYISGGTGDNPEVRKAQADSVSTMAALGIMKNNTAENVVGECVTSGEITGLNLTGFATGDELFVSDTTAGGLLTSAPTGEANLIQKIGKVVKGGNGGALTVLGAFRTNATPNLDQGSIFIGNASNQATTLGIGNNNTVLTSTGSSAAWEIPRIEFNSNSYKHSWSYRAINF